MYKAICAILVVLFFSCNSKPERERVIKNDSPAGVTKIEFEKEMHNFGQLEAGEILLYSFSFTNVGDKDFVIDELYSDCGCITASYENKTTAPGETAEISIEFNTAGLVGKEFKTIEVRGNSEELKHLAIFAEVKNELLDIKY